MIIDCVLKFFYENLRCPVHISGSGVTVGSYVPNWSDFFPPPPACPPSETESGLGTPLIQRHEALVSNESSMEWSV